MPQLLYRVVVPHGARAGDVISVSTATGLVQAAVPPGLVPGQAFHVTFSGATAREYPGPSPEDILHHGVRPQ